jgi:molybdopterin synthase catalytic subunit
MAVILEGEAVSLNPRHSRTLFNHAQALKIDSGISWHMNTEEMGALKLFVGLVH